MHEHEDIPHEKKISVRNGTASGGMPSWPAFCEVAPEQDGERLDMVLAGLFPELGLRARRRLWEWCAVTVNGIERRPACKLKPGQVVRVLPRAGGPDLLGERASREWPGLRLVASGNGFAALAKPPGLPSASLAGKEAVSAEALLKNDWAGLWREFSNTPDAEAVPETPFLCNRLDTATSGLLLLAFGRERLEFFRACERRGEAVKKYLALVRGRTPQSLLLDRAMDTDGRKLSRVLDRAEPDRTRHTAATLRQSLTLDRPGLRGEFSLLEVRIWRGARHQIRAQLAAAGFPIAGDALYGLDKSDFAAGFNEPQRLYLHHFELILPVFSAYCPPDWGFSDVLRAI